jgi:protease I
MSPALIIIAPAMYQDVEFQAVHDALIAAGFSVVIGSTATGTCTGKFGGTQEAAVALRDVQVTDYDRIVFIGGPGAAALAENHDALGIARDCVASKIPLGAICLAPTILAASGMLNGLRATVWDDGERTQIRFLETQGARFSGEDVTVDGLIVTGNGPEAAAAFGKAFAQLQP